MPFSQMCLHKCQHSNKQVAFKGRTESTRYLFEQDGIEYNMKDKDGDTALMIAANQKIEDLFLSGYGIICKKNDLDVSGFKTVGIDTGCRAWQLNESENFVTIRYICATSLFIYFTSVSMLQSQSL